MLYIREEFEKIKNFFAEKGKTFTLLVGILALLIISIFIMVISHCSRKKEKRIVTEISDFNRIDEMQMPQTDELFEEYYFSRASDDWNGKDKNRFWNPIDQNSVDRLGKTNDTIVQEITGATP